MTIESTRYGYLLGPKARVLLWLWSLFLVMGFSLALVLKPDPRGFGTHQRLGLPPCTVRVFFSVPCPGCGMTTSFSNFVRGRFIDSARANAAGFLLAIACVIQIPWSWISVFQGRLLGVEQPGLLLVVLLSLVLGISLLQWGYWVFLS
jgi:hypothetical protein